MSELILEIKNLCVSYGLLFADKGNGHIQIKGHGVVVNYYPLSKHKTVFCAGLTTRNCTPYNAITICRKNGKAGLKPKKKYIKENPPDVKLGVQCIGSIIKHQYTGERPPWDFPTRIMCS